MKLCEFGRGIQVGDKVEIISNPPQLKNDLVGNVYPVVKVLNTTYGREIGIEESPFDIMFIDSKRVAKYETE